MDIKPAQASESTQTGFTTATGPAYDQHPDIDLPIQFKIYCDKNRFAKSLWYIGLKKGHRLKTISCDSSWRSKLEFHDGVDLQEPVLASSVVRGETIEIHTPSGRYMMQSPAKLSVVRSNIDFSIEFPVGAGTDRFTWRRSSGPDVKSLGGRGGGWVLICESTNEPVAVYSADYGHIKLSGRFKFMSTGASGEYGREWAVMAIISALSIGQRKRGMNESVIVAS